VAGYAILCFSTLTDLSETKDFVVNEQPPLLRYDPRGVSELTRWYLGFAVVYAAAQAVGFAMRLGEDALAVFWPALGVLCASLTLLQGRHWAPLLVLASAIELIAHMIWNDWPQSTVDWLLIMLPVMVNVGEALVFALVMHHYVKTTSPLYSVRKLGSYVLLGVLLNTAVFTMFGADVVWLADSSTNPFELWLGWFFGDYIGLLAVGTAILAWVGDRSHRLTRVQRFEAMLMLGSLGIASALLFALPLIEEMELLAPVLVLPWVAWSLARFPSRFVVLCALIITVATVTSMRFETGPFSAPGTTTGMQVLAAQSYLMPTLLSVFFLTTVIEGRRRETVKRLEAQEELRRLEKSRALGTMAAGVAHDFGNLMMAIQAYQSTLRVMVPQDLAAVRKAIDGIGEAASEAQILTGSLMHMSQHKPEGSGSGPEISGSHDLRESVQTAVTAAGSLMPDSIHVVVDVGEEAVMVQISAGEVQRIVANLLINARDATTDRKGEIHVLLERQGSEAHLTVRDNGMGMSEEVQERMFDPFFTTKMRGKGTGLGLAVVRSLVTEHSGSVQVQSVEGNGTSITVTLPLHGSHDR
jgi:signal transduction histidine kinase